MEKKSMAAMAVDTIRHYSNMSSGTWDLIDNHNNDQDMLVVRNVRAARKELFNAAEALCSDENADEERVNLAVSVALRVLCATDLMFNQVKTIGNRPWACMPLEHFLVWADGVRKEMSKAK